MSLSLVVGFFREGLECGSSGRYLWAGVFTFNPYLLISINELMISIIHLLISTNELLISINELLISINELLISINELLISINELLISINTSSSTVFIDINNSFIDINRGPFKCYVTQMGVGGCLIFWKKALRRCNVQCY